ncbi:hypothetical protein IE81DRAFT_323647 [Ceraceosorus guamensis]|uniref:Uncharacterized protein n=1 Tax=Ceraceosorus guamensis TaxID=1522189 RepID=A0A316W180_9BASI|nr:hypothetical protein IE81DRAFT_323647 [Ceraceosorus guamensis]PWN42321.1 hypothetical protein IE81DRAFT_323647 [Ceraceosorus guamensis]
MREPLRSPGLSSVPQAKSPGLGDAGKGPGKFQPKEQGISARGEHEGSNASARRLALDVGVPLNGPKSSGPPLLTCVEERIAAEGVYINHAPSLSTLTLRNLSAERRLLVRLESELGRGISFLKRKRTSTRDPSAVTWPANTVIWAQKDGLSPSKLRDLRHFVANLEPADSFILEASSEIVVYVSFRPVHFVSDLDAASFAPPRSPATDAAFSPPRPNARVGSMTSRSSSNSSSAASPAAQAETSSGKDLATGVVHESFSIHGSAIVRSWPLALTDSSNAVSFEDGVSQPSTGSSAQNDISSGASNLSSASASSSSSRPTSTYGSLLSSAGAASSFATTTDAAAPDQEPQVIQIPFSAWACKPQIAISSHQATLAHKRLDGEDKTSPYERHNHGLMVLDFGDLFVGQREERDLVLYNQSAIECFWQARLDDADSMLASPPLSLVNDTERTLETVSSADEVQYRPHILAPGNAQTIKLVVSPTEPCRDFEQVITVSNLHNASNSVRILVRANMLGAATDDALSVLSGDIIDFGDCCGGHWTRQLLVLKNAGDVLLELAFGVQKGIEANFQLAELAPQDEDIGLGEPMLPPVVASQLDGPSAHGRDPSQGSSALSTDGGSGYEADVAGDETVHVNKAAGSQMSSSLLSPSQASSAVLTPSTNPQSWAATDMARTPTHHARATPLTDPPHFELPTSEAVLPVGKLVGTNPGRPRGGSVARGDEVDASSVASQAGSIPGSPELSRPSLSTRSSNVEQHCAGPDRGGAVAHSTYGVGSSDAQDKRGAASNLRSRPSSAFFGSISSYAVPSKSELTDDAALQDDAQSMLSEVTGMSDGRPGAHHPPTRVGTMSNASGSHSSRARVTAAAALSGLRNAEQSHSNRLEELLLRPGSEYRVVVSHRPARGELDAEYSAGRLREENFQISLDYARARSDGARARGGRQRKTVQCRVGTCTSFITVSPKVVDFGEANVGARKFAHVAVENRSELTARIDLRFVSKVLSMYRDEVSIPALQTVELRVDFFPRRINKSYRKQITVANLMNRSNDQIFEVRSRNVDEERIGLHSLFYRILTPSGANFVDFNDVNINSLRLRTFSIQNLSASKLDLELSSAHPEDLRLFVRKEDSRSPASPTTAGVDPKQTNAPASSSPVTDSSTIDPPIAAAAVLPDGAASAAVDSSLTAVLATSPGVATTDLPSTTDAMPVRTRAGADLKERFIESISNDAPASLRRENATWRLAQKHSHFRGKKDGSVSKATSSTANRSGNGKESNPLPKPKAQINLVAALKKGGKGRITLPWGNAIAFKDRTLITSFEYLDLASGPPVDQRRISPKSKKYILLESIVSAHRPRGAASVSGKALRDVKDSDADAAGRSGKALASDTNKAKSDSIANRKKDRGAAHNRKLPQFLADDIHQKDGKPSREVSSGGSGRDATSHEESGADIKDLCDRASPALTGKRKPLPASLSDPSSVSKLSLQELVSAVEAQNPVLSTYIMGGQEAEEKVVRTELNLQRELQNAIDTGQLVPLSTLELGAHEERQIIGIYSPCGSTRPHIQGNARKQDSRIFMRLVAYDSGRVRDSAEFSSMALLEPHELPVRDLMVKANVCRSLFEIGQPHINFGHVDKSDTKTRKILIQNRSEWALRYCVRKSGSIASSDIRITSGLFGVVPGHGKREVEFIFSPSMSGQFQERLTIENVADRDNNQVLSLKATVRKVPKFSVEPLLIDFGHLSPAKLTAPQHFILTNTTSKARTFVVEVDGEDLRQQRSVLDVVVAAGSNESSKGTLSKAEEEEVEHISQKLKIATRKGHDDKVKKYETRLAELGARTEQGVPDQEPSSSTDEPATATTSLKRTASTVTVTLAAEQSARLLVRLRPHAAHTALPADHPAIRDTATPDQIAADHVKVRIQVHEVKNRDEMRVVELQANINLAATSDPGAVVEDHLSPDPLPKDAGAIIFSTDTTNIS